MPIRILRHDAPDFAGALGALNRRAAPSAAVQEIVAEILTNVQTSGDEALLRLNAKFGGPTFTDGRQLRVTPEEMSAAPAALDARMQRALAEAHENVRAFALKSLRHNWRMHNRQGVEVGERFSPYHRVGLYVPGGTAPLVSTAIMTCTLAAAAGVRQIVVTTPADKEGRIAPALLCALQLSGATEIYKVGGAQAVAALAFGTESITPVDKIFGPGNSYVVEAKRQVFGHVGIDLLPGPSEVLVLADRAAKPAWIAADMLAQAEHGTDSLIGLVTDSPDLLFDVQQEIERQLLLLARQAQLGPVLEQGAFLCLAADMEQAVAVANNFAPEHLALCVANPDETAALIHNAGAIFLGGWSPVAGGDFLAGPSHTLPTGGAAKSFSGLTVDQFQRRISLIRFDEGSLRHSLQTIQAFSDLEGLDAHGRSAAIRFDP